MIETKPYIAFVVERLNQFCHDPSVRYKKSVNKMMNYFKNTIDLMLVFNFNTTTILSVIQMQYTKAIYKYTILVGNKIIT